MKVMALACVAMMDSAMAYQGMRLAGEQVISVVVGAAAAPQARSRTMAASVPRADDPVEGPHRLNVRVKQ